MPESNETSDELEELQSRTDDEEEEQWESESLYADALDGVAGNELFKPCKPLRRIHEICDRV